MWAVSYALPRGVCSGIGCGSCSAWRCHHQIPDAGRAVCSIPLRGKPPVRPVLWILIGILALHWVAAELPPVVVPRQLAAADPWRRTDDGWEKAPWLSAAKGAPPVWLHPAGLGLVQFAVAIGGFLIFGTNRSTTCRSAGRASRRPSGGGIGSRRVVSRPPLRASSVTAAKPCGQEAADG